MAMMVAIIPHYVGSTQFKLLLCLEPDFLKNTFARIDSIEVSSPQLKTLNLLFSGKIYKGIIFDHLINVELPVMSLPSHR